MADIVNKMTVRLAPNVKTIHVQHSADVIFGRSINICYKTFIQALLLSDAASLSLEDHCAPALLACVGDENMREALVLAEITLPPIVVAEIEPILAQFEETKMFHL